MRAQIERAQAQDASQILSLVEESQLTTDGLVDHLATIVVARLDRRIVGTAALEIHRDGALLRSVAVSADVRGQGLGAVLVESALQVAEELSVRDVYLLTFTAENYFQRFGFQLLDRGDVPAAVRTSVQFTHACPSTASVMRKRLRPPIEPQIQMKSDRAAQSIREPSMSTPPIACTLTPEALRTRREGLLMDLVQRAERRDDLPDGLRLEFAPSADTIALIARVVEAERHCCRFLRFAIMVEPDGGPVFLDLSGPPGTRDFVSALIEA